MSTSSPSGPTGRESRSASSTPGNDGRDYSGGLVGHKDRALDVSQSPQTGTTHEDPGRDEDEDSLPIGSALAAQDGAPAAGTDADLTSGPSTLGATTGGERASAGRSDANRNSRDHGNSRGI
jgi:hypothetical protein